VRILRSSSIIGHPEAFPRPKMFCATVSVAPGLNVSAQQDQMSESMYGCTYIQTYKLFRKPSSLALITTCRRPPCCGIVDHSARPGPVGWPVGGSSQETGDSKTSPSTETLGFTCKHWALSEIGGVLLNAGLLPDCWRMVGGWLAEMRLCR
jgi:hypothetical protein